MTFNCKDYKMTVVEIKKLSKNALPIKAVDDESSLYELPIIGISSIVNGVIHFSTGWKISTPSSYYIRLVINANSPWHLVSDELDVLSTGEAIVKMGISASVSHHERSNIIHSIVRENDVITRYISHQKYPLNTVRFRVVKKRDISIIEL